MGKHETGYARQGRDFYPTPAWPIEALAEQVELRGKRILECACGDGRMARALEAAGANVTAFDIADYGYGGVRDFLRDEFPEKFDGTITNPPYGPSGKTAEAFIETGIRRLSNGFLALLLPADFDSAVTRRRFFDECPAFTAKIILTRRIKWFQNPANPKVTPKENSAWFLWMGAVLRVRRPPIVLICAATEVAPHLKCCKVRSTDFFGGKQMSRTASASCKTKRRCDGGPWPPVDGIIDNWHLSTTRSAVDWLLGQLKRP